MHFNSNDIPVYIKENSDEAVSRMTFCFRICINTEVYNELFLTIILLKHSLLRW